MFKFRFESIVRLRENERDMARASLAEAYEAMNQLAERRQELLRLRGALLGEGVANRTGEISMERLLTEGRYERQLAAELAQLAATEQKVEAELIRRQGVLADANAAVRQMELLREQELAKWTEHQNKIAQANLDEIAARRHRALTMGTSHAAGTSQATTSEDHD